MHDESAKSHQALKPKESHSILDSVTRHATENPRFLSWKSPLLFILSVKSYLGMYIDDGSPAHQQAMPKLQNEVFSVKSTQCTRKNAIKNLVTVYLRLKNKLVRQADRKTDRTDNYHNPHSCAACTEGYTLIIEAFYFPHTYYYSKQYYVSVNNDNTLKKLQFFRPHCMVDLHILLAHLHIIAI